MSCVAFSECNLINISESESEELQILNDLVPTQSWLIFKFKSINFYFQLNFGASSKYNIL